MARIDGTLQIKVEQKHIDAAQPLRGKVRVEECCPLAFAVKDYPGFKGCKVLVTTEKCYVAKVFRDGYVTGKRVYQLRADARALVRAHDLSMKVEPQTVEMIFDPEF